MKGCCGLTSHRCPGHNRDEDLRRGAKTCPRKAVRVSGNSKAVDDPFDTTVGYSVASIQMNEELVAKDGGEELGTVVVQSSVPNSIFQQNSSLSHELKGSTVWRRRA